MQTHLEWKVLIIILTLLMMVRARTLTMAAGACPMRDVSCADGHENVVSVLFSVDAAQVRVFNDNNTFGKYNG